MLKPGTGKADQRQMPLTVENPPIKKPKGSASRLARAASPARAADTIRRDDYILSQVKDCVICTDANGIVTYWNKGAEQIFGWQAHEMLGHSVFDRLPTEEARVWGPAALSGGDERRRVVWRAP